MENLKFQLRFQKLSLETFCILFKPHYMYYSLTEIVFLKKLFYFRHKNAGSRHTSMKLSLKKISNKIIFEMKILWSRNLIFRCQTLFGNCTIALRLGFSLVCTWRGSSWGLKQVAQINYLTKSQCLSYWWVWLKELDMFGL